MNNRKVLIIASVAALILVAAAMYIGWRKDGRVNPGLIAAIPVLLIGLAAALRNKPR